MQLHATDARGSVERFAAGALGAAQTALKLAVIVASMFIMALIVDGLLRSVDWASGRWLATGLAAFVVTLWMLFAAVGAWQLSLVLTLLGGALGGGAGALLGFLIAGALSLVWSARSLRPR